MTVSHLTLSKHIKKELTGSCCMKPADRNWRLLGQTSATEESFQRLKIPFFSSSCKRCSSGLVLKFKHSRTHQSVFKRKDDKCFFLF